jgi:glycosyltransferase involved in cell wall biosynthesis
MKIGIAGPIDLSLLGDLFPPGTNIPEAYSFAFTANLARALYIRGHEITLFALSREVTETQRIDGERITACICPQRRPRYQMLDFFRAERHSLRDAMRTSGCNVIHAHWIYEFGSAALQSGLPHVLTAHDVPTVVLRYAQHPYWLEKPLLAWPTLKSAECLTAVSPYTANALRRFVRPGLEITVVPNGVTQNVFDLFTERHGHSDSGAFTFASVLNEWSGRKNGKRLIEAFATLRKELGGRVRLVMFGNGHELDGPAHQWAKRRRLTEGVEFEGSHSNHTLMSKLAEEVSVLVHPALEETFCVAAAEAMTLGIPVIGGQHSGGITWVLDDGRAGMLVDVTSPATIAEGMRRLLLDANLRNSLGEAGRKRALAEFHIDQVAAQYEGVLLGALREQTR